MMKNLFQILCGLFLVVSYSSCMHSEEDKVDVLIIGGGASGVTSGIQSARMGANTLILEESTWLGGMLTSAGVRVLWMEITDCLPDFGENLRRDCLIIMAGWIL